MKRCLLLAGLLCCGSAWGARSEFQMQCENRIGASTVKLTSSGAGYSIDNSLSYRALGRLRAGGPSGTYVLGLTRTESRITVGVEGGLLLDRQTGYECIAPQISVALTYVPIIIYVGREFVPGTCPYKEILAHEMRHLKTYLDQLPKVETLVRATLKQRFPATPIYARAGQAKRLLEQEMDGKWMPYIKSEMSKVEHLQNAIDSPQEYIRLSKVCKGEVQLLIAPQKRNQR